MEFLPKRNRARFRMALIAIAVLFVLDISLLVTTFLLSDEVKEKAIVINLSGRQRMLSQRMVKCLLLMNQNAQSGFRAQNQEELALTFRLFDSTLTGLLHGGLVENGNRRVLHIKHLKNNEARELLEQAQTLWLPYREKVLAVLQAPPGNNQKQVATATATAIEHNRELLRLMNDLTTLLENNAISQTNKLHTLQSVMMGLAILSFSIMLLIMRRELSRTSKNKDALDKIIHTISSGILVYDDRGIILAANAAAADIFGYRDRYAMEGKAHHHLLFKRGNETLGRRQDGSVFHASAHSSELPIDDAQLNLETVADITLQRSVEESLSKLAYYDALTGLPNRLLFDDRLHQGIFAAKRQGSKLAVLFVDLNKFKQVNDNYGHHIGDMLLKEIADRLKQQLREEDTISRLGGDEFVVLLTSITSIEDCEHITAKLLHALRAPFVAESVVLQPDASIGICLYPDHGEDERVIVMKADQAMYSAKRDAERHYAFYSEMQATQTS